MGSYYDEIREGTVSREEALKQAGQDLLTAWGALIRMRDIFGALELEEERYTIEEAAKETQFIVIDHIQITDEGEIRIIPEAIDDA